MSTIPAMFSDHSVIFYDEDYVAYSADESNPNYAAIIAELKSAQPDIERLVALTQPITAVRNAVADAVAADYLAAGKVSVTINEIRYDGEIVEGALVDRILAMLAEGFDIMPMVRFLENLFLNPADFARDELYLWLEKSTLPITEDGYFLAYKRVNRNFTSIHDGKTMNVPGTTVQMKRTLVDPIRDNTCSRGLHFCSKSYLPSFGSRGNGSATLILKVNPADVVSIPSDYDNAKGRAWKYEVLRVVDGDPETMEWPSVVDVTGSVFVVNNPADEPDYFNDLGVTDDVDDDWDADDDVDDAGNESWDDDAQDGSDADDLLEFPSDLASALFAAIAELGIDTKDKDSRLNYAYDVLDEREALGELGDWSVYFESFHQLTKAQAGIIIEASREAKAEQDAELEDVAQSAAEEAAEAAEAASDLAIHAKRTQIDAINSYGIIKLRQLTGKWKGYKVSELRQLLIDAL